MTALSDAWAIFLREVLRYRRDRAYWVGQLAFPLVFVAFIGFGLNDVVELPSGGSYVGFLASGMLVLVVGSGAVGGGFTLIQDREQGFLRALLVAPVSRAAIVLGKVAARLLASGVLVALLVAILATFTPVRPVHPLAIGLSVLGVTTSFVALGIALASRLASLESFRLLSGLVTVPIYLLSGMFYPIETLPVATKAIAYLNPLSYGVDLFRYGLLGEHEFPLALSGVLLALLSAACTWIAVRVFAAGSA